MSQETKVGSSEQCLPVAAYQAFHGKFNFMWKTKI